MRFSRLARLRTIAVVLCALLLAQWSLAAHACPTIGLAGKVPAEAHATTGMSAGSDCCDDEDAASSTLCYKHCNADEQVPGGSAVAFAAPPAPLRIERAPEPLHTAATAARLDLAHATAPPLTILYCVSLT